MKTVQLFTLFLINSFLINAQTHPFPQHIDYTGTHIEPNQYTQEQLDKIVTDFYDLWKSVYLKSSCGGGFQYFVSFDDGATCVSV
ncbi:MAG: hypothetical protein L3J74_08970 [Bacteroidales bacterium]|nr:hypothetical protein [Bacteroidales bacterium]